jgi:EmrB/QacA subfamily drug resistance transporter
MNKPRLFRSPTKASSTYAEPSSDLESAPTGRQPEWKAGKSEWAVMLTLAIISLMVALDATILVPVLPTLAVELNGSATDAFWAGTSYLLTSAVFQPLIASLSDIFGRKEMLIISILLFTLGTLLCAPLANNFTTLLVGRSIQGIGGGGVITLGQVIYADIVPLRQRPKYFSLVLGAWALGSVAGPLIGGVFDERASWKWCFYINFPFCAVGLVLVPLFVKLKAQKTTFVAKLKRVDWLGGFLFVGGATTTLIGLSWAGIQFAWNSAPTLVPICVGLVTLGISIAWECRTNDPFIKVSLFSSYSAKVAYAGAFCNGFILFCALYYIPLYFMAVRLESPIQSGINLLPVTCLLLPGSILVSVVSSRIGHFRWAVWIGWAITACGCGFLVLFHETTQIKIWATVLAIFGIGSGMVLTSLNVTIQAISPAEDSGRAAAMYAFMRSIGMCVGVAVGGTTFQNVMINKLDQLALPADIARDAEAFIETLKTLNPTASLRLGALEGYVHGLHGVFWLMTGLACAGLFLSLFIRSHSMNKLLKSEYALEKSSNGYNSSPTTSSSDATLHQMPSRPQKAHSPTPSSLDFLGKQKPFDTSPPSPSSTESGSLKQPATADRVLQKKPSAEMYYFFPNGARIPARIPARSKSQLYGQQRSPVLRGSESGQHPNEMRGIAPRNRISMLMHREGWV